MNLTQIRHDASFLGYRPTVSNRFPEAASMCYRTLTIGKGSANDVQLDRYGHCNFTHPKHAVIFYDEVKKSEINSVFVWEKLSKFLDVAAV